MNTSLNQTTLLAETRMSDIQGRYQSAVVAEDGSMLGIVIFVAAAVTAAALIYLFFFLTPAIEDTPEGLLSELCNAHEVSRPAQRLIHEIGDATTLPHPAIMFFSRDNFEAVLKAAQPKMAWNESKLATLRAIRRQMFDA